MNGNFKNILLIYILLAVIGASACIGEQKRELPKQIVPVQIPRVLLWA